MPQGSLIAGGIGHRALRRGRRRRAAARPCKSPTRCACSSRSGGAGDYLALLAYVARDAENAAELEALRLRLAQRLEMPVLLGYGPRYLHSIGQLYKGGPASGLFVIITSRKAEDLPIPGARYTFAQLQMAQALGDMQRLAQRKPARRAAAPGAGRAAGPGRAARDLRAGAGRARRRPHTDGFPAEPAPPSLRRAHSMDLGFIGLGRMGGNMVERLLRGGHRVWAYTAHAEAAARLTAAGGSKVDSLPALVQALPPPRRVDDDSVRSARRSDHRVVRAPFAAGRHADRRRQQQLQGLHAPRGRAARPGASNLSMSEPAAASGV